MANGSLMKVESVAECSPWSILQYFWPELSDDRLENQFLVPFLSGRLRQVSLYFYVVSSKAMFYVMAISRSHFRYLQF